MKTKLAFFISSLLLFPAVSFGASCSKLNLTKCLDSACAINIGANPAARCQYCGTASAGVPTESNAMKSISLGSTKYTFTDKELKSAPTDPGQRYVWATTECIKKVDGCTTDDVSDTYDSLIEQSCKAAGISAEMASLSKQATKTASKSSCNTSITACIISESRCNSDYRNCEENTDFDKFFASCSVEATGCDEYISDIRTELLAARDTAIEQADKILASIVKSYQEAREQKIASTKSGCADNSARDKCIETVCANNMRGNCNTQEEKSMATSLCKFYEIACETLN